MKLALLLACCALPAAAATLKPYTQVGPVVLLSDLFDGAGATPLGPSPGPGGRITVEAPQLAAIARMFHVDWRPAGPGERTILERPGRTLGRDDVLAQLRSVLELAGAPRDSDIDLPGFTMAPLPTNAAPSLDFSNTAFDAATGRFSTMLTAMVEGAPPAQARLSGRVQEMTVLPVTRRAMVPGEVVTPADLQWTRLRVGLARGDVVRLPAQAEGQALRRPVPSGQPLQLADLGRPVIVAKGAPLLLHLDGPGLQLTAQGVAAEAGGLGERIHVTNPYSRAVVEAEVTGPGRARVIPAGPTLVAAR